MEKEQIKGVGNAADVSVGSTFQNEEGKEAENRIIDYKSHDKALGQLKRTKEENQRIKEEKERLESELTALQKERQRQQEEKLAEQGEYKKLLELKEQEAQQLKQTLEQAKTEVVEKDSILKNARKLDAVLQRLPGPLHHPDYANWIDLESVVLNPDTNEIDDQSADLVVNSFMKEHSKLVDTSRVGRIPGNAPGHSSEPVHRRFKDLPLKDMKKNIGEAVRQAKKEQGVN